MLLEELSVFEGVIPHRDVPSSPQEPLVELKLVLRNRAYHLGSKNYSLLVHICAFRIVTGANLAGSEVLRATLHLPHHSGLNAGVRLTLLC